jgi:hypothetical protein
MQVFKYIKLLNPLITLGYKFMKLQKAVLTWGYVSMV